MNRISRLIALTAPALGLAAFTGGALAQSATGLDHRVIPHRVNTQPLGAPTAGSTGTITPVITYHGGPVMAQPTIYTIWYGNWAQANGTDTAAGQDIVRDFLSGLGGSGYYMINHSYANVSGALTVGGETTDSGSQSVRLTDSKVQAVVSSAITSGRLPTDSNGIYLVLTSSNIAENSGFCNRYCGWHTSGTIAGTNIKYSFVGNAARCPTSCAAQSVGPNGNAGVDGMISVIAHEIEEANTDPNPTSGWADSGGAENADKCAWTFGQSLNKAANGAYFNVTLNARSGGTRNYLVQRNLDSSSKCWVDFVARTQ